jgi:glutaredoxin-like YruB-family protein
MIGGDLMKIKVYSTPSCMWCSFLKQYLESKEITFEDVDVSKDRLAALEMIRKSGQRGVPVIDINGNIVVGFDRDTIDKLLSA